MRSRTSSLLPSAADQCSRGEASAAAGPHTRLGTVSPRPPARMARRSGICDVEPLAAGLAPGATEDTLTGHWQEVLRPGFAV